MIRSTMVLAALALWVLAPLTAPPALAQKKPAPTSTSSDAVDATRPQVLLAIAKSFGTAELTKDDDRDPLIRGELRGKRYFIFFYGCTNNVNCNQIEFRTFIKDRRLPDRLMSDWNKKYRYGKAYRAGDDVIVNWLVNLRNGGVSRSNMEASFEWFSQMHKQFHEFMR